MSDGEWHTLMRYFNCSEETAKSLLKTTKPEKINYLSNYIDNSYLECPDDIKLVLFDMDLTMLSIHTQGYYTGSLDTLKHFVMDDVIELMLLLLKRGKKIGIVSFSDPLICQIHGKGMSGPGFIYDLLFKTLKMKFETADIKKILDDLPIVARYPKVYNLKDTSGEKYIYRQMYKNNPNYTDTFGDIPNDKSWHIEQVLNYYKKQNIEIKENELVLFDDSLANVLPLRKTNNSYHIYDRSGMSKKHWNNWVYLYTNDYQN